MATMKIGDIPNEVLTIYSRDAIFASYPNLYFRQFVKVKNEFQNEPGETVQFLKLNDLPAGGALASETAPIPKNSYADSTVTVTVQEYGNAVQVTRRALEASFRPILQDSAVLLGRDYGKVVDGVCRDAFLSVTNKQYTDGSSTAAVASGFDTDIVKDAVEVLKTQNAPMIVRGSDQFYVCIAHPHQLRNLRDSQAWIEAHKYTDPSNIFNGEAGRYENVIFLETTQMPILTGQGSGGADVYRSVLFGSDVVGFGETVPMQLVNDGVEDFGRLISIGYYSIFGAGVINGEYGVEIQST